MREFVRLAIRAVFTFILCVTVFASIAAAQEQAKRDPQQDKQALINLENYWLAHEEDPVALQTILADDFVHVLPMGLIDKNAHVGYWRREQGARPHVAKHFEDLRARIYGDVGIVNGIFVAGDSKGARKTIFTDVFVYRSGRWQAVNAQENDFRPPIMDSGR